MRLESEWKPIPKFRKPIKEADVKKLKESMKEPEEQIPDLVLYLGKILNVQQCCDFYWVVANLQMEYQDQGFMTLENNSKFAKVYNKA